MIEECPICGSNALLCDCETCQNCKHNDSEPPTACIFCMDGDDKWERSQESIEARKE